jgi:membrane protein implicated in regulation of membrane protease activity
VPKGPILAYNKVGEFSYSVYIWHWPIGQTLFSFAPGLKFYEVFIVIAPLSIAIAALSWKLVERPALRCIPGLAYWLEQCVARVRWPPTRQPVGGAASTGFGQRRSLALALLVAVLIGNVFAVMLGLAYIVVAIGRALGLPPALALGAASIVACGMLVAARIGLHRVDAQRPTVEGDGNTL